MITDTPNPLEISTDYPLESTRAHPPMLTPSYVFTRKRAPHRPLRVIPHTLTELSGPIYGHDSVQPLDNDLTKQGEGEPIGERIFVHGQVMDEDGRAIPNTLIEIWQANAAGRYIQALDSHPAPLDPNFYGAGRTVTADDGTYTFTTIKPGPYPIMGLNNYWRPAHIHLSLFGPSFLTRLVTQLYFEGDPLIQHDMIYSTAPESSREAMIAKFDMSATKSEWALAYRFDIVLRGQKNTHIEA